MSIVIGTARPVSIPTRRVVSAGRPSVLAQKMDSLSIGEGFDYTVSGVDKETGEPKAPLLKNQYTHTAGNRWSEQEKSFKVFAAEDQSDLQEGEARFTIVRTPFVAKAPKAAAAPAVGTEGEGLGEGQAAE